MDENDFEQVGVKESAQPQDVVVLDDDIDTEQAYKDVAEGIRLIEHTKILLDYVSDPILVKRLSKRERDAMADMSGRLQEYLATMYPTYVEEFNG